MATTTNQVSYLEIDPEYKRQDPKKKYPPTLGLVRIMLQTFGRIFPGFTSNIAFKLFATPMVRAKHKSSDKLLESAKIFDFLYAGELLKGYEWGEGEKIAILVHGWESRGTALRSMVPILLNDGYKVVAFDGPAHGNSTGKRTHLIHFSGALKALITRLGTVDLVITHSFGGAAITYTMQRYLKELYLDKLIMIAVPSTMRSIYEEVVDVMKMPSAVAKRVLKKMEKLAGEPIDDLGLPLLGKGLKVGEVLIIHDKEDNVVPFSFAENIFNSWENAELAVTEGLGHYRILKNEAVLDKVHQFLKG
ncbi:MAG: alpha/beta hydrolase [Saprospiraceae bacterium]